MPDLPPTVYVPAFGALCAVIVWQGLVILSVLRREQKRSDAQAELMSKFVVVPKDTQ